jgi:hypothetical protein
MVPEGSGIAVADALHYDGVEGIGSGGKGG